MSKKIDSIPRSWILTTLGEIGIVVSGGTPSSRQPEFWGGDIAWITPADLSNYKNKYIERGQRNISKIGLDNSSARLLIKGTVLFSSRAPIGYTVIAKNEIATNQGFKNLILTKSGYSDYIYYYLQSSKQLAESYASGTTFLELSSKKFSQIPIPLPPIEEQYRIVNKIEELFSELDNAQENLLNAQKQLEIYRQVILREAFEKNNTEFEFHLGEVGDLISGQHIRAENYSNKIEGVPYLTGPSDFGKTNPIITKWTKNPKTICLKDDILITVKGSGVGKVNMAKQEYAIGRQLMAYRFKKGLPSFIYYFFLSIGKNLNLISSGTAIPGISRIDILNFSCQVPSIERQLKIVQEIEYRFTLIENLEKSIIDNLKRIEVFRHVILQKAFSGNLISQNINDEPAFELLKRIKEEIMVYRIRQTEIRKNKPLKLVFMESNKTIKEILEDATEPMEAKEVWQKSVHKDDIEKFYEELKRLSANIVEIREGKTSKLSLKK